MILDRCAPFGSAGPSQAQAIVHKTNMACLSWASLSTLKNDKKPQTHCTSIRVSRGLSTCGCGRGKDGRGLCSTYTGFVLFGGGGQLFGWCKKETKRRAPFFGQILLLRQTRILFQLIKGNSTRTAVVLEQIELRAETGFCTRAQATSVAASNGRKWETIGTDARTALQLSNREPSAHFGRVEYSRPCRCSTAGWATQAG